jgi:hypothetical protein
MNFLRWIQETDFATWIRESDWAIFAILIVHTIGMGFLVGTGIAVSLRILGIAKGVPLSLLIRLVPVMKFGLTAAIVSGALLVVGYPAKALTNPLFYIKLLILTGALLLTAMLLRTAQELKEPIHQANDRMRKVAFVCLLLWLGGVTAGKFLAYTNTMLLVE